MTVLEQVKQKIADVLTVDASSFSYPPQAELGDLSMPCFVLAKKKQRNPVLVAKDLEEEFKNMPELLGIVSEVRAAGAYLNFFIDPEYLAKNLLHEIKTKKEKFGHNNFGAKKSIMIEFSNGNTHKEYHVGHLRNICYGEAVVRLLDASAYKVIPVSYINDFGIHVAKVLWFWDDYLRRIGDSAKGLDKGYLLGKCYSAASQKIADYDKAKEEVAEVMKAIESRTGKAYKLWQTTRKWSIDYFAKIYKDLGVEFKDTFYESDFIAQGLVIVADLLKKGILEKSQGAIIANFEKYNLGILPIIRSDGTALYPVADLALAIGKFKKYKLDESVYVTDLRQSLYFKQLFKILELMGRHEKMSHLVYDFVTLPSGMMASRTGNVITYHELKQEALEKSQAEIIKRHNDWSKKKIAELANKIALGAIKFEMLKVSAEKIITFDVNEALRLNGYTSVYLQYACVRINSLIKKANLKRIVLPRKLSALIVPKEKELLMKIAKYPAFVLSAATERDPSNLVKYLFELAQLFNDYYQTINILQAETDVKNWRLSLLDATRQTLKNGLELLGLEVVSEM